MAAEVRKGRGNAALFRDCRALEAGARPPADLSAFEQPTIVVVIPFEHATEAKAAA
jgi:hypothetical protein